MVIIQFIEEEEGGRGERERRGGRGGTEKLKCLKNNRGAAQNFVLKGHIENNEKVENEKNTKHTYFSLSLPLDMPPTHSLFIDLSLSPFSLPLKNQESSRMRNHVI